MLPQVDLFSFPFWKNLKTPKDIFVLIMKKIFSFGQKSDWTQNAAHIVSQVKNSSVEFMLNFAYFCVITPYPCNEVNLATTWILIIVQCVLQKIKFNFSAHFQKVNLVKRNKKTVTLIKRQYCNFRDSTFNVNSCETKSIHFNPDENSTRLFTLI